MAVLNVLRPLLSASGLSADSTSPASMLGTVESYLPERQSRFNDAERIPKQKRRPKAPFQSLVRSNLAEDLKIRRRRAATLARKAEVQLLAIAQTGKA